MRIISQDGRIDSQYESCTLSVEQTKECSKIYAYIDDRPRFAIAEYSTIEKALKVMEMLNYAYKENQLYSHVVSAVVLSDIQSKKENANVECFIEQSRNSLVWQFPKDEDVDDLYDGIL